MQSWVPPTASSVTQAHGTSTGAWGGVSQQLHPRLTGTCSLDVAVCVGENLALSKQRSGLCPGFWEVLYIAPDRIGLAQAGVGHHVT